MSQLNDCRLYGILDLNYVKPADALQVTRQMVEAGVDILQLRSKTLLSPTEIIELGSAVQKITDPLGVPFLINDYPQIVGKCLADGVHIGQNDGVLEDARAVATDSFPMGTLPNRELIVGRSTHSLAQAKAAWIEGADYIGFGPLFATPTKPDYKPIGIEDIAEVHQQFSERPIFCIGGIKLENLPQVLEAGAKRVVIVSGILQAENITRYVAKVKEMLLEVEL